jgi:hypothetical protein
MVQTAALLFALEYCIMFTLTIHACQIANTVYETTSTNDISTNGIVPPPWSRG